MTLLVCCLLAYNILCSCSCTQHWYNDLCTGHWQCQNCLLLASFLIFITDWKLISAVFINYQNAALLLWGSVNYWAVFIDCQNAALFVVPLWDSGIDMVGFMKVLDEYQKAYGDSWKSVTADETQQWAFLTDALTKFQVQTFMWKHKYFLPLC